ncbi:MAG: cell division protein FtsA [Bacillaceae bacterium]|nr:cell division protein FtsA [Bacillaceae bacterium]
MSENTNEAIFSLDIGTRSVVGLILEPEDNGKMKVAGCEVVEHEDRSMLDGQIHDVVAVSKVIRQVKEKLEKNHGPLHKVAVAAAGRSLKTIRASVEKEINGMPILTRDDILALELSAVQDAQKQLAAEQDTHDQHEYYCVGYSVVHYYLDHEVIGNLIDQRGETASVEVIATFLPRVVVDSLLAALKRADLEMNALTLEPIAAINVLIPSTMRKLNIALVDIGAGTSDIAIAEHGTITAYGMVPSAGDEITEALSEALLLDFTMAEQLKRNLNDPKQEEYKVTDILGFEQTMSKTDILDQIDEPIDRLAQLISDKILELNGRAPQAVMLIGGGSQIPRLTDKIAKKTGLSPNRVAVRGADALQNTIHKHRKIKGPEFVTPVGIAVAATLHPVKYLTVTVNDNILRIFDLKELTIGDALLHEGIDIKKLHGRPGLAVTIQVNGKLKFIPGGHGTPPSILLNGEPAHLDTPISEGDSITVIKGEDGADASASVKDVIDELTTLDITIDGRPYSLAPLIRVNGEPATLETSLTDRDELDIHLPSTLEEVVDESELLSWDDIIASYTYRLNGSEKQLKWQKATIYVNGRKAGRKTPVKTGDRITIEPQPSGQPLLKDVIPADQLSGMMTPVTFNGEKVNIHDLQYSIIMNGEKVSPDEPLVDGATIRIERHEDQGLIFSDVFRYVEVDTGQPPGKKKLVILVNGEPADLNTPIKAGDHLEMRWEA